MSHSPATPNKDGGHHGSYSSPGSAVPSTEKLTSTSKLQRASIHEPSPASTYGETVDSSVPATPQDDPESDLHQNVMNMLKIKADDLAIESIHASPARSRGLNSSMVPSQHASRLALVNNPSPTKHQNVGALNFPRKSSTNVSPATARAATIKKYTNWRPEKKALVEPEKKEETLDRGAEQETETFMKHNGNETDDVFGSPDHRSKSAGHEDNARPVQASEPISNDNAQALLPPSACVFVANLTQSQTDDQLEHHVQNAFSQFGTCYVKIRRDSNGMPFAFVQYETVEDAQRAITQGRGMPINNRPCRTEVAKVNRSLYLSRVTGGTITEAEARNVLSQHGDIEKVWYSSPTESEIFRLPEGIWVMFKMFQPSRDAQAAFRDHSHYRLEQPPMADDFRARLRPRQYQSMSPLHPGQSPGRILPSPMRQAITTDVRSIFVGNLPANMTEEQLFQMFILYGPIQDIEIVRKPSANPTGVNVFAFIEYTMPEAAAAAVQGSPRLYGNVRLRVERKESMDPPARFHKTMSATGSSQSPYLGDAQDQMAMLYQRGIYAGLAQAAQAMPPPTWAGFPYCQPGDPSQYCQFTGVPAVQGDIQTAPHMQLQVGGYPAQTMGQVQYPQAPAPYFQYPQQPARSSYQWPPAGSDTENIGSSPSAGVQEAH